MKKKEILEQAMNHVGVLVILNGKESGCKGPDLAYGTDNYTMFCKETLVDDPFNYFGKLLNVDLLELFHFAGPESRDSDVMKDEDDHDPSYIELVDAPLENTGLPLLLSYQH
jgi:hypothetical protein